MEKDRLVAFSDGVIAIIITIRCWSLKVPHDATLDALVAVTPAFLSYALSFVYVAIYWNNHHHFFHLVRHVSGTMLWANMHLLFWLSLIPFATGWMGENHFAPVPTAVYGVGLLMPAIAWYGLQLAIIRSKAANPHWRGRSVATSRARLRLCSVSPASCSRSLIHGLRTRSTFW